MRTRKIKISCIIILFCLALVFLHAQTHASCPVSLPGQYSLTYNDGTKYMTACKFGDSYRNMCGTPGGSCTPAEEGDLEYNAAGEVLRYCNGSNWINIQCEALGSCAGEPAGKISADPTQMKYCNGTTWQAMYNDGICSGIGVQEALFTPTGESHGQNTIYWGKDKAVAMTDTWAAVGATYAARMVSRDGAVTMFKRSGASWARVKELEPSTYGREWYFGQAVSMDGDYVAVGAHTANRIFIFTKDEGGVENWGQVAVNSGDSRMGQSVDIEGDRVIAGAPYYSTASTGPGYRQGRARIYRKEKGGSDVWGLVTILNHPEPDIPSSDYFGYSVSIAGDIAAVGSGERDEGGVGNAGAVWLFHETSQDNWVLLKKLVNPNGLGTSDEFGSSVDIKDLNGDGMADRLIVGANGDDQWGSNRGTIFVFERNQGGSNNWGLVAQTSSNQPPASASSIAIGWEVALAGDRIVARASTNDDNGTDAGAAIIFGRDIGGANNWGTEQYIYPSDPAPLNQFGQGIAASETGNYMIAGSIFSEQSATNVGAAYIFSRSGSTWTQRAKLTPPSTIEWAVRMGDSVAVSGDYAATGIIWKTTLWNSNRMRATGGVDIYRRAANGTWSKMKHVTSSTPATDASYGIKIKLSPEILAVASPGDNTGASDSGAIILYGRNIGGANNWGEFKKLKALDRQASDAMGAENGLALFGDYIVAGAYADDGDLVPPESNAGSAYIFHRNQGGADNWGQVKKLVPPVEEHDARFGGAVDMAGQYVAVGAWRENANGNDAGAVYLFSEDQGGANNWGLVKKFIGESASDRFGYIVSLSGNTLVVGAPYDDDSGADRGAAYIYYKDQGGTGNWGLFKKIAYPGVSSGSALFGFDLAIAGDILIVGAPYDDTNGTDAGYTFVYSRNEGGADNWGLLATIVPDVPGESDYFGYGVAVSGNVVASSGLYNDDGGKDDGSVYLFGCPPTP